MESRETELCNKLYKTEEEQQIFFGFSIFETRTKGNNNQSKIFLDFSNIKPKIASKANQSWRLKRQTKRINGNIFGLFVFWNVEIRTRTTKKMNHGYT
jgi:hypothetical protein